MKGRPEDPNRAPRVRFASLHPVGTLSMFPGAVEVSTAHTNEMPGANEQDPVVYLSRPAGRGPRTPTDLFYLRRLSCTVAVRVYFKEVIPDA